MGFTTPNAFSQKGSKQQVPENQSFLNVSTLS